MSQNLVCGVRYLALATPELGAERAWAGGPWGLKEVAGNKEVAYFSAAGSSEHHVLRLRQADEKRMDLIGLAAPNAGAVDSLAARLGSAGVKLISQPGPLNGPGGGYGFRFFDVDGRVIEVSSDVEQRPARDLKRGESVPGILAHIVLHTPDVKKTVAFYTEFLGFRVSDWLGEFMCFIRCDNTHHNIAFVPGPPALNHVAFEMHSMNEMMMGAGRLTREGHQISWGPGRHTAGDNTFCYFKSPSGFSMEYTAEVQRINEANWKPNVYEFGPNVTDYWGISRMGGGGAPEPPIPDPGVWKAPPI